MSVVPSPRLVPDIEGKWPAPAAYVRAVPPATVVPLGTGNYSVDHAAYVLAFTTGDEAHAVYPDGYSASTWAHDLPRLVSWRAA